MTAAAKQTEDLGVILQRWRDDARVFVRECFSVEPTKHQDTLLEAITKPGAKVAVRSGHGTGKTTSLAWSILWFLLTHDSPRIPCTATTGAQISDVLWSEISKQHNQMEPYFKEMIDVQSGHVFLKGFKKTAFAVARSISPGNDEALQGFHADNIMYVVDEASGVRDGIFTVAEGALTTEGARVVMTGNPTKTTGYFHRAFHKNRGQWTLLHFNGEDSPLVTDKYVNEMIESYTRDSDIFRVRVLGDFPHASVLQFIGRDIINQAAGKKLALMDYDHAPKIIGVDVARFGDDQSVIAIRQGLRVHNLKKFKKIDTMELASQVAHDIEALQPDAVFIDGGAMGPGVIDRLRQLKYKNVHEVHFGGKALNNGDEKYYNKRAEMWGLMRKWLHAGGCIPDDAELIEDLAGPEYGHDGKEQIQLEQKSDMKKRDLASPDCADALAVTFAFPVYRDQKDKRPLAPREVQKRKYQPIGHMNRGAGR